VGYAGEMFVEDIIHGFFRKGELVVLQVVGIYSAGVLINIFTCQRFFKRALANF
jgi:hypothetical protein